MTFDAIDFLTGLFGATSATGPTLGNAADQADGNQPEALEPTAPAASTAEPATVPVTIRAEAGPGGCLALVCPTPELAAAIEAGRPALETLLMDLAGEPEAATVEPLTSHYRPADGVEPGEPCPRCGSLEKWWDLTGGEHCQRCEADKLARSFELADRAARLRRNRARQKTASPFAPRCEQTDVPDALTLAASGRQTRL